MLAGFDPQNVALAVLIGVAIAAVIYAVLPAGRGALLHGRALEILGQDGEAAGEADATGDRARRRRVRETLKEMRIRQMGKVRSRTNPTLMRRLRQAGLEISVREFVLASAVLGAVLFTLAVALGVSPVMGALLAAGGAVVVPRLWLDRTRTRRLKKFSAEFPGALDLVVRGVRSGLPLIDCLSMIARESESPLREEFSMVLNDQQLGLPLSEAIVRLADRVPTQETTFFSIVVGIQSRSGGNLSEPLSNLSTVIRARRLMSEKIKAMSAEAKASAWIIGMLPPLVVAMMYFVSPDYVMTLVRTSSGNIVIAASGLWMFTGIMVMRSMINFDF